MSCSLYLSFHVDRNTQNCWTKKLNLHAESMSRGNQNQGRIRKSARMTELNIYRKKGNKPREAKT